MKTTLTVEIEYDPAMTDGEGLACAMDRLLETALSTPGIFDEYGNPKVGEFFVAQETVPPAPKVILNISGGVLQDVIAYQPGEKPEATFPVKADRFIVREYCNLHGPWKL